MTLNIFLVLTVVAVVKASHFEFDSHALDQLHIHPKLISQSVQLKEVPTKIIKITKTVAIRVPVPYPVQIPHHIPVPVPVAKPVAVPVPQIVKVPHHVPVEVQKPYPVEVHQQVPLLVSKPIAIPHPVPVPHPVTINKPVYYPVPHPVPYHHQSGELSHNDYSDSNGGADHNYLSRSFHRDHLKDSANEGDESNAQTFQVSQSDLEQEKNYGTEREFSSASQNYNQTPQDFSKVSKSAKDIASEQDYSPSSQNYNGKNYSEQY